MNLDKLGGVTKSIDNTVVLFCNVVHEIIAIQLKTFTFIRE